MAHQVLDAGVVRDATPAESADITAREQAAAIDQDRVRREHLSAYMAEFRGLRDALLNRLAGIALAEELVVEFKVLRRQLLDIPDVPSVASATTAAQAKHAIKAEYIRIVQGATPPLVSAFREMDQ